MSVLENIGTIVILMMENRSFDHLLGALSLPEFGGCSDIDGLSGEVDENGLIRNRNYKNYDKTPYSPFYPYIAYEDYRSPTDLPHCRETTLGQFGRSEAHGGLYLMNRFAAVYSELHPGQCTSRNPAMAIYNPAAIPMTTFLAENFTVCNRWFTSIPTDTHPNRFIGMCGYTHIDGNCYSLTEFHAPEMGVYPDHYYFFDWLDAIGVSWRFYHQGFSFLVTARPSVLCNDNFRRLGTSSSQYRTSMERDFMEESDLPQVIFVEPGYLDDITERHPNCNHPPLPMAPGERFVRDIYRAVTRNPARWQKTVFIVYYDEHGGFFDHVPPIPLETQPGKPGEFEPFYISGARVPAFIVSPYAEAGVCNENLDHTSILRLLAEKFTPGKPYSDTVHQRHQQPAAKLASVAAALTRDTPRSDVPRAPAIPKASKSPAPLGTSGPHIGASRHALMSSPDTQPTFREPKNIAEKLFAKTYENLLSEYPDEMRKIFPGPRAGLVNTGHLLAARQSICRQRCR